MRRTTLLFQRKCGNQSCHQNKINIFNVHSQLTRNRYLILNPRYTFAAQPTREPLIPTTSQPEGFRASDKPIGKHQTMDGRFDPFKAIHHERAKTRTDFQQFDAEKEFNIHPFWTPIVPAVIIGLGLYIIVSGVIAHPPGDDE